MTGSPSDHDVFDRWRKYQEAAAMRSGRVTADQELTFWRERAVRYDATGSLARSSPAVVEKVLEHVSPGESVLEIGTGTGELTIPVALRAGRLTAVDLSPDMLAELVRKVRALNLSNVTPIRSDWEAFQPSRHDVVLAVNSLYRLRDPRAAMSKIVQSARRKGILVRSIGANPPPPAEAVVHFGSGRYDLTSDHELMAEGLRTLGIEAQLEILTTGRTYCFRTLDEAAAVCLPWQDPTEREWQQARDIVRTTMTIDPSLGHVMYVYLGHVAIITWDAAKDESLSSERPTRPS